MTLPLVAVAEKRETLTERLARYFRERPGQWIDAHDLMRLAGFAGWRTRVSELRGHPHYMDIQNRTRRVTGYTESCYRYVSEAAQTQERSA